MRRPSLAGIAVVMAVVWMVVGLVGFHAPNLADRLVFANLNTLRDFEVYGQVRHGLWPLQGPITSVGGNHGWLAGPVFGLALTAWPSLDALYAVSLGVVVAGWLVSLALAWRLAPGIAAALGATVLLGTHLTMLVYFPSHIVFILLGTPLAFLGAAFAKERWWGPALAGLGIAVAMGGHRTGWALLVAFLVAEPVFGLGVLRRPSAWAPLLLYLVPDVLVAWLGGSPTPTNTEATVRWLEGIDPWLVARLMPFVQLPIRPFDALQGAQMLLVAVGAAGAVSAARTRHEPAVRFLVAFYVVSALGLLFVRYDGQYYMPMLSVLPAILALATTEAVRMGRGAFRLWTAAVLGVTAWSHHDVVTASFAGRNLDELTPARVADEEALLAVLGDEGMSRSELFGRTVYLQDEPDAQLAYLAVALLPLPDEAPEPDRCFRVERAARVAGEPGWRFVGRTLALKIEATADCAGNVRSFEAPIWYADLRNGTFVRR